jgi:L,D-peptidoglycan transpeptidase YkuD (ErfK/YbiS/YcfS/YnhG family)
MARKRPALTGRPLPYTEAPALRSSPFVIMSSRMPARPSPPGAGFFLRLFAIGSLLVPLLVAGCSHTGLRALSREANRLFDQGQYEAALGQYQEILDNYPEAADRVLFEMGVTHVYPLNPQRDYRKALACFQKLLADYPDSVYRQDGQMMILQIHNALLKDETIAAQQAELEDSRQALARQAEEMGRLRESIAALDETVFALRAEAVDKVLIEKQARRLTLLSRGAVVKTYPIALGGDPVGPKERQGDNKTPEGTYTIEGRNGNSAYHLSLRISYPNAQDRKRARALGVAPGGDIMIHGLKNGFAQAGAAHTASDWTEGCIAVTNPEMEEIYRIVPNGTVVEIVP